MNCSRTLRIWACIVLAIAGLPRAIFSAPPVNPLLPPLYSFDLASPTVTNGFVEADDVLALNFPFPVPVITGAALGLGAAGDDLDGLSGANSLVSDTATFMLRFSVDRDSTGAVPPDPALVNLGLPYNVADQAARGHQAGDEYISMQLYTRQSTGGTPGGNHTLSRNNYDEGGTDFGAQPPTSAQSMAVGAPQDNVDGLAASEATAAVYFSATATSPSLATLPGGSGSGVHVYRFVSGTTTLYASAAQLGLQQADDLDALVVFDTNANGLFDGTDQVLFSLAPGSPSLATLQGASAVGAAADVFSVSPGIVPQLFASASSLGLGAASDNIDALEILPCTNSLGCLLDHSIRLVLADFDYDGDVDADDMGTFDGCFTGEGGEYEIGCEPGDFDFDFDVDCTDRAAFDEAWTGGSAPPRAECLGQIPTISELGVAFLAALLLAAGAIIIRRRTEQRAH